MSDPVVDIVSTLAHAYERALVAGDGAAAGAFFAAVPTVSRFGPEGEQFGPDAVSALRAGYAALAEPVWIHDETVVVSPGVAIHKAVMHRGDATLQRTQVWSDLSITGSALGAPPSATAPDWKIVHAHVSRSAAR